MLSATIPAVCKVTGIDGRGQRLGGGSGFVVDDSGHVVTNAHVIVGLTSMGAHELIASFDDGRVLQLEALALDVEADIAVARLVTPDGTSTVPHLTFGSSSALRRGDPVAVLGAPLGGSSAWGGWLGWGRCGRSGSSSGRSQSTTSSDTTRSSTR